MGANETFSFDTDDREVIARELLRLTAKVASRMRTARVAGRTVTITVRFAELPPPSPGPRHLPSPPTSPWRSTARRWAVSMHWVCSGRASGWSGSEWRVCAPGPRCIGSSCSGNETMAGPTPTGPWIVRSDGSVRTPYARPA